MTQQWDAFTFKVSPEVGERIRRMAVAEDRSHSAVIRRLIRLGCGVMDSEFVTRPDLSSEDKERIVIEALASVEERDAATC